MPHTRYMLGNGCNMESKMESRQVHGAQRAVKHAAAGAAPHGATSPHGFRVATRRNQPLWVSRGD